MKKILVVLLSLVLLFAALPVTSLAANVPYSGPGAVIYAAQKGYEAALEASGMESFEGYCGMLSSYLLWHMGVTSWVVGNDGNQQYDYYKEVGMTSGGYYVNAYSAEDYTLREALNYVSRSGTRNVYNLLVCFEKTTTAEGQLYGHSMVIYAILDGKVYYMENLPKEYAGSILISSIDEFANSYEGWTEFEGLIHFGKDYSNSCQIYGTDLFIRARYDTTIRSQPCVVGKNDCVRLRSVAVGELLRTSQVCQASDGQLFYLVKEGDQEGYVAASAMSVARFNAEDLAVSNLKIPEKIYKGEDPEMKGQVISPEGTVQAVEMRIVNAEGNAELRSRQSTTDYVFDLTRLNEALMLDLLEAGTYQVEIYGEAGCQYAKGQELGIGEASALIYTQSLEVVDQSEQSAEEVIATEEANPAAEENTAEEKPTRPAVTLPDPKYSGWLFANQTWYCFREGRPVQGWLNQQGFTYYLQPDGAVTTGYAEVEGQNRYFSSTGVLCNGWMRKGRETMYLRAGFPVVGWLEVDGCRYYFREDGLMQTSGTQKDGEITYQFQSDGRAMEKK